MNVSGLRTEIVKTNCGVNLEFDGLTEEEITSCRLSLGAHVSTNIDTSFGKSPL